LAAGFVLAAVPVIIAVPGLTHTSAGGVMLATVVGGRTMTSTVATLAEHGEEVIAS
jgi:hypothetical protein